MPGFTFEHPTGEEEEEDERHGPGFIDDQFDVIDLETNEAHSSIPACQANLQSWQNVLNVSGGDLVSLAKCGIAFLQYTHEYHKFGDISRIKPVLSTCNHIISGLILSSLDV